MKKIKNFLRFCFIGAIVLVVFLYIGQFLFKVIWNFNLLDKEPYLEIKKYWDKGHIFGTFRDYSLGLSLIALPIIWFICSYKLYKYGLKKFLTMPIIKTYRRLTRPKSMDVEHVVVRNLGVKDKSLDDIIANKIKEEHPNAGASHITRDLRQQISAKIEENENK